MISTKHFDSPLYELESMENYESVVYFTLRSFTKSLHHAAMKNISSPPGLTNISRINFVCILKNLWLIAFANAFLSLNISTISTPPQIFISFMEWWVNFFFMHLFLGISVSFCLALKWNNYWEVRVTFLDWNFSYLPFLQRVIWHVCCFSLCPCSKIPAACNLIAFEIILWLSYSLNKNSFFPHLFMFNHWNFPVPLMLTFHALES